jgi:hypothetical protein
LYCKQIFKWGNICTLYTMVQWSDFARVYFFYLQSVTGSVHTIIYYHMTYCTYSHVLCIIHHHTIYFPILVKNQIWNMIDRGIYRIISPRASIMICLMTAFGNVCCMINHLSSSGRPLYLSCGKCLFHLRTLSDSLQAVTAQFVYLMGCPIVTCNNG